MNGTWSAYEVAGHPAEVYRTAATPRFAVLYLHSGELESLRGRAAFTRAFDEHRLACVCPQGGLSWWADRVCDEFDPAMTPERWLAAALKDALA